ncbi:hypothetical protein F5Y14DRAFT_457466 [Nemania sp. NC0429]|nr:hypothetical protein F5Y14DRAFT_457466 [Nemania sp. NC0429]
MRNHQQKLFDAINKTDKIVYIAGTGGGKSVAFSLPAYVQPDGCSVVIQPTRALQKDTHTRLAAISISFAQRQRLHKRIDRVILNKAQEILTASQAWRRTFLKIRKDMDLVSRRQVYLTRTLPPSEQSEFLKKLQLKPTTTIIQAPTVRNNLRYEYVNADGQRAIIFTLSKVDCNLLSEKLQLPKHHGEIGPQEQQKSLRT